MKYRLVIFLCFAFELLFSQSSIGFIDNYSGIQAVSYNPANILDTQYKFDFNIITTSIHADNNNYSAYPFKVLGDLKFGLKDIIPNYINYKETTLPNSTYGLQNPSKYIYRNITSNRNNFYASGSLLGPSFLWSINHNNAIAVTTSLRFSSQALNINTKLISDVAIDKKKLDLSTATLSEAIKFVDDFDLEYDHSSEGFYWAELGVSYAGVIKSSPRDFLKLGGTLKFLRGIRTAGVSVKDLDLNLNYNPTNPTQSSLDFSGNVVTSFSENGTNFGMGLDLGMVYERRDKNLPVNLIDSRGNVYYSKSSYTYKLGFSIIDFGYLNYDKVVSNRNIPNNFIINLASSNYTLDIENYFSISKAVKTKETYLLPTTARFNFDYNINTKWYLNANYEFYMLGSTSRNRIHYISNFVISPRYETEKLSIFMPFSLNEFGVFKSGIGIRTGYFFLGSSSLFTNLSSYSKSGDLFLGLKIPFLDKKVVKEYKYSIDKKYSNSKLNRRR